MHFLSTTVILIKKQIWASLFAILLLTMMFITFRWNPDPIQIIFHGKTIYLYRYDLLFLFAIGIQGLLLLFKLETGKEAFVILIFHIIGTIMELFKTSYNIQSWQYPENSFFKIGNVPLFTGFMYSAIGSYIARSWRTLDFRFSNYPTLWMTWILGLLIYINFFSHHFIYDFRWILLTLFLLMYYRSFLYFTIVSKQYCMPLILALLLVAIGIWIAENISTYLKVWEYPYQRQQWKMVSPQKVVAWLLLMSISFILISLINKPKSAAT